MTNRELFYIITYYHLSNEPNTLEQLLLKMTSDTLYVNRRVIKYEKLHTGIVEKLQNVIDRKIMLEKYINSFLKINPTSTTIRNNESIKVALYFCRKNTFILFNRALFNFINNKREDNIDNYLEIFYHKFLFQNAINQDMLAIDYINLLIKDTVQ